MKLNSVSHKKFQTSTVVLNSMATPLPFPSLEENPRIHFATFKRHVYDDAGSSCCDLFTHGLLFLVVDRLYGKYVRYVPCKATLRRMSNES